MVKIRCILDHELESPHQVVEAVVIRLQLLGAVIQRDHFRKNDHRIDVIALEGRFVQIAVAELEAPFIVMRFIRRGIGFFDRTEPRCSVLHCLKFCNILFCIKHVHAPPFSFCCGNGLSNSACK